MAGANLESWVVRRGVAVVIDGSAKIRDGLAAALASGYWPLDFADIADAVGRVRVPPAVVVLGAPASDNPLPVRSLRAAPAFREVPIVLWRRDGMVRDRADAAPDAAGDAASGGEGLRDVVARLTSGVVEQSWARLPEAPHLALQQSRAVCKDLARLVPAGRPLAFAAIAESCRPLLAAVRNSEHRWVFEGLRGHDDFDYAHSVRMAALLGLFGMAAGLDDQELMTVVSGGFVHDAGMAALPADLKTKVTRFSEEDRARMRGHVALTVDYLERHTDTPRSMIAVAAEHHERLDGSGYPKGLHAGDLNDLSRMAAIVDVFAALTEDRPYRAAMSGFQALEVMGELMAPRLDQRLVRLFRTVLLDAAA